MRRQIARRAALCAFGLALVGCKGEDRCGSNPRSCGFACSSVRLAEGNPSQSGVASVDQFFSMVLSMATEAGLLGAELLDARTQLARSLKLSESAPTEEIEAAVLGRWEATAAELGLFVFAGTPCRMDFRLLVRALRDCDASVDPEDVDLECSDACSGSAAIAVGGTSGETACSLESAPLCSGKAAARGGSPECELWAQFQGWAHADCPLKFPAVAGIGPLKDLDPKTPQEIELAALGHHLGRQLTRIRVLTERATRLTELGEQTLSALSPIRSLIEERAKSDVDLKTAVGLTCAPEEFDRVPSILRQPLDSLGEELDRNRTLVSALTVVAD